MPACFTPRVRAVATLATLGLVSGLASLVGTGPAAAVPTPAAAPIASLAAHSDPDLASPTTTVVQLLKQPTGYAFKARMTDVKVGGLFETAGGYGVERDEGGTWHYIIGWSNAGKLMLGAEVTRSGPPSGLAKHLGRHDVDLTPAQLAMRETVAKQFASMAEQLAPQAAESARSDKAGPRVFHVPALMLATWYDEEAGENAPQFHGPTDSPAYFKKLLDGFGGNPYGSVTQYYYEASFGQFLVEIDVYGTYTSAKSVGDPCYYGSPDAGEVLITDPVGGVLGLGGLGALGMGIEAIPQAAEVPWATYDNDDDGVVDFTMIIHSGGGHEVTGDTCNTHSHQISASSLANIATGLVGISAEQLKVGIPTTTPGVFVDRLLTIPEFESEDSPLTIGVAAHEMAHALGEPDYYDTGYTSVGTGDFDIMSGGSYLGNPSGSNPAMQNPATRVFQHYVTPTIVHGNLKGYTLKPRTALPKKGYRYGQPDPDLLLVPTYERKVGQTDSLGHEWTAEDVYGLAYDKTTKSYVVEGFYVENVSRNAVSAKIAKKNPMGSMFDRQMHSSGLAVWHFDYWRQSTTYFGGSNDAQSDPNRYQMDLEEFDRNDNTQELQLNYGRGNADDLLTAAATGITSGTHLLPPGVTAATSRGKVQKPIEISGTTTPITSDTVEFDVDPKAANASMDVTVNSDLAGDCKLQLVDPTGKATAEEDSGGPASAETISVENPAPGTWKAVVSDFLLCGSWSGRVIFAGGAEGSVNTYGAADTWSNWSTKPTGWAFTNVRGYGNGLDMSQEGGGSQNLTLDVLDLSKAKDASAGFVVGKLNKDGGQAGLIAGRKNALQVPVFSNGGKSLGKVQVDVRLGSAKGKLVARRTVKLGAYGRGYARFSYKPKSEGPVDLVTVVDPKNRVKEGTENNQVQSTQLWVGPRKPDVLIVDDDQVLGHERALQGALSAIGVRYATVSAHPTYQTLKRYRAVIWSSGVDRYEGQLDAADRKALGAYLDHGGRVMLTGNRIMDAISSVGSPQTPDSVVAWGAHYFGTRIPSGNSTYIVSQTKDTTLTGTGFLGKLKISTRPSPARQFVGLVGLSSAGEGASGEVIAPYGKASGLVEPPASLLEAVQKESDAPYLGVSVTGDAKHQNFKTVALGWNLGDSNNAGTTAKVLRETMAFFGVGTTKKPTRPKHRLIYTNPVRDSVSGTKVKVTAVVLGGTGKSPVTLYYRRHDTGKFTKVTMGRRGNVGTYGATIPAKAVTPRGVDYYLRAKGAKAPYGAIGEQKLYYSIAVALPLVKHA